MPDGLVTVGRYEWEMEASLARSRLAAAGIPSWTPESSIGSIYWHYAKALGGIRLQVSAEDAEDARAILDEIPVEEDAPEVGGADQLADRVLRAAVFGCVVQFPIGLYAAWLLVRLLTSGEPLGPAARRKAAHAAALVVLTITPMAGLAAIALLQKRF